MATIATLFSGGEGVGVGAGTAGLTHLWGIEYDDDIANVARDNGFHVITADVMSVDPATLETPDVLHASPVCKRASVANQSAELNEDGTKEAPEDIAAGEKVAQFIEVMQPRAFTLENVFAYRNFKAFKIICHALDRGGYMWDFDNLNSADYGVPQTRRRLVLRAVRGALLPNLPQPERWVGWYEAIDDLVPTLPESQFAKWQLARLPEAIKSFISPGVTAWTPPTEATEPIFTIQSSTHGLQSRAFILDCQKAGDGWWSCGSCGHRWGEDDKPAVCPNCNQDDIGWIERGVTLRQGGAPMFTVTSGKNGKQPVRAFLVGTNANDTSQAKIYQDADEPAQTVRTPGGGRDLRAWFSQGRVVAMTPRALARFQSLPDSYLLPDNKKLACTVIGNMVPPLLYQKIIEALTETI